MKHALVLEKADDLVLTRKYNGATVIAHMDKEGEAHLYSRRMDDLSWHFPHLTAALNKGGMAMPPESILLFEAFMGEGNTQDEFEAMQSVMRSKAVRAQGLQDGSVEPKDLSAGAVAAMSWAKFYLYRVPIWKGEHLEEINTCGQQCELIENTFFDRFLGSRNTLVDGQYLYALENVEVSVAGALDMAKRYGWEGYVAYQKSAKMAGYSFSFHGKPDRPICAFKIKPVHEDDFIAFWEPEAGTKEMPKGSYGSGKNSSTVGTISLYQYNSAGELVYICECSGFNDDDREYLDKAADYPEVVVIEYSNRSYRSKGRKSNALLHPRFDRVRTDKLPDECVNPDL
jgi:hypothetical protein